VAVKKDDVFLQIQSMKTQQQYQSEISSASILQATIAQNEQ
jgi:hypothetical protein